MNLHSSQVNVPNTPTTTPTTPIPIKLHRPSGHKNVSKNLMKPQTPNFLQSPFMKRLTEYNNSTSQQQQFSLITLDSIVTEYLRKQHALCITPVVTCPPFDLFNPHRCPEPINRNSAPVNIAMRIQRRQLFPRFGGVNGAKMDRKFIYSRFRPVRTYRDPEATSSFTSCAFSVSESISIYINSNLTNFLLLI